MTIDVKIFPSLPGLRVKNPQLGIVTGEVPARRCSAIQRFAVRYVPSSQEKIVEFLEQETDGCPHHESHETKVAEGVELILGHEGRVLFRSNGETLRITPRKYLALTAGDTISPLTSAKPFRYRLFRLYPALWRRLEEEGVNLQGGLPNFKSGSRPIFPLMVGAAKSLVQAFRQAEAVNTTLLVDITSLQIGWLLLQYHPGAPRPPQEERVQRGDLRLKRAIEYVHDSFRQAFSLNELARASGASRRTLVRLFQKELGASPFRYVMNHRTAQAVELLKRDPHLTVEQVSERVGFGDPRVLYRLVRAATGVSTRSLRNSK